MEIKSKPCPRNWGHIVDWLWTMNPTEQTRLAHALNELRPDWPISSLATFIGKYLAHRAYRDAAVMLAWVATDANSDGTPASIGPKRVLEHGPWAQAAVVDNPASLRPSAPKREESCLDCGRHLDGCLCGGRVQRRERGDASAGVALVRAAMGGA